MPNGKDEQLRILKNAWSWLEKQYPELAALKGRAWDEQGVLTKEAYNKYQKVRLEDAGGLGWEEHPAPPSPPRADEPPGRRRTGIWPFTGPFYGQSMEGQYRLAQGAMDPGLAIAARQKLLPQAPAGIAQWEEHEAPLIDPRLAKAARDREQYPASLEATRKVIEGLPVYQPLPERSPPGATPPWEEHEESPLIDPRLARAAKDREQYSASLEATRKVIEGLPVYQPLPERWPPGATPPWEEHEEPPLVDPPTVIAEEIDLPYRRPPPPIFQGWDPRVGPMAAGSAGHLFGTSLPGQGPTLAGRPPGETMAAWPEPPPGDMPSAIAGVPPVTATPSGGLVDWLSKKYIMARAQFPTEVSKAYALPFAHLGLPTAAGRHAFQPSPEAVAKGQARRQRFDWGELAKGTPAYRRLAGGPLGSLMPEPITGDPWAPGGAAGRVVAAGAQDPWQEDLLADLITALPVGGFVRAGVKAGVRKAPAWLQRGQGVVPGLAEAATRYAGRDPWAAAAYKGAPTVRAARGPFTPAVTREERRWLEREVEDPEWGFASVGNDEVERVVWGVKSGDTLSTGSLDYVGYGEGPATLRGIHIGDADFWKVQLEKDYGLSQADARTIRIRAIKGDAYLPDRQYDIPPEFGEMGESRVLVTKRTRLEYGKDWVFEGETFAPTTTARVAEVPAARVGVEGVKTVDVRASYRRELVDTAGKPIAPDDEIIVYHNTTAGRAAAFQDGGITIGRKPTDRPTTIITDESVARMLRMNVGDALEQQPGRGRGPGLYVSLHPSNTQFGDTAVGIKVRVRDLQIPPERTTSRMTPGQSLLLDDGYLLNDIPSNRIVSVESALPATRAKPTPGLYRGQFRGGGGGQRIVEADEIDLLTHAVPRRMNDSRIKAAIESVEMGPKRERVRGIFQKMVDGQQPTASELRYIRERTNPRLGARATRDMVDRARTSQSLEGQKASIAAYETSMQQAMAVSGEDAGGLGWTDSFMKFHEWFNNSYFGLQGLQTGTGVWRRIVPLRAQAQALKGILPGGWLDVQTQLTNFPGLAQIGLIRDKMAVQDALSFAKTSVRNGEGIRDINQMLTIKHGQSVFRKYKKRTKYGPNTRQGLHDLNEELFDKFEKAGVGKGAEGIAELERAADVIAAVYRRDLYRYVEEGYLLKAHADSLVKMYPFYNPIYYVDDIQRGALEGPVKGGRKLTSAKRSAGFADSPIRALSEDLDVERALTLPLENLKQTLIKNEYQLKTNQIKRAVIALALDSKTAGVHKARKPVKLVATVKDPTDRTKGIRAFRPIADPEGHITFYSPDTPGVLQVYAVPEWIRREIDFLGDTFHSDNIFAALNGWFRATTTTYNPLFIATNVFNDMLTAGISKGTMPQKSANELRTTIRGIEQDILGQPYILAGGRQQKFFGESMEQAAMKAGLPLAPDMGLKGKPRAWWRMLKGEAPYEPEEIRKAIAERKGNAEDATNIVTKLIRLTPTIGEAGELAPRMATARKRLNKTDPGWEPRLRRMRKDYLDEADEAVRADKLKAYRQAQEDLANSAPMRAATADAVQATVAFAQGGRKIKWLNQYILFLNAAMEGAKIPHRALQREPGRVSSVLAGLMMGQGALTYYNTRFPEYFDIPLYERMGSIIIMSPRQNRKDALGHPVPARWNIIPRTREWAAFLSPVTYLVEQMYQNSPESFNDAWRGFISEVVPNYISKAGPGVLADILPVSTIGQWPYIAPPVPEVAELFFEQRTNYDFFRDRPIVPESLSAKEPSEQVLPWTSPLLAKLAGQVERVAPDWPLSSPIHLEHIFNSVFGAAGREVLTLADDVSYLHDLLLGEAAPEAIEKWAREYREIAGQPNSRTNLQEHVNKIKLAVNSNPAGGDADKTVEEVIAEAKRVDPGVFVLSGLQRRFLGPSYSQGEIRREAILEAIETIGAEELIDPKETRNVGRILREVSDERMERQEKRDLKIFNPAEGLDIIDSLTAEDVSNKRLWRDISKGDRAGYEGAMEALGVDSAQAAQLQDAGVRNAYYARLAELMAAAGRPLDRDQVLLAGYYAIYPTEAELLDEEKSWGFLNIGLMFEQREEYRSGLSDEDRDLLDRALAAGRTVAENRYYDDVRKIRETGFWDVTKDLANSLKKDNPRVYGEITEQLRKLALLSGQARRNYLGENKHVAELLRITKEKQDQMRIEDVSKHGPEGPEGLEAALLRWGFYDTSILEKYRIRQRLGGGRKPLFGGPPQ